MLADVLDFRAEKDRKRRNLGGQADATLTHLKALILIHNNNTSKIKNGACHQPGPACRPVSAVDRRPGERNFFSELDQEKDRGSLSQAWGGGRWDRGGRLGAKLARTEAATVQLYKIRNSISSLELFINSAVILKYTIGNHIHGFIHKYY